MISLALTTKWDLSADSTGNIKTTDGMHALEQDVSCVCREFRGENYYNIKEGIPYFADILGQFPPRALLKAYYDQTARKVPGVVRVNTVIDSFKDRKVTGQIRFTDKKGIATIIEL